MAEASPAKPLSIWIRLLLGTLQVFLFFVLTGLLAQAYSRYTAETYAPGVPPSRHFSVLTYVEDPKAKQGKLSVARFAALESRRKDTPGLTLKVPVPEGAFETDEQGWVQRVRYQVLDASGGRQRIEMNVSDDDYSFVSRYATDGSKVEPEYLQTFGGFDAMIAFLPALLLTWLIGRLIKWLWRRRTSGMKAGS